MSSRTQCLRDFAEDLLTSGADRIKHRFDGRRVNAMRRNGLLVYPDGTYSLSVGAMKDAVRFWVTLLAAHSGAGNEARMRELASLTEAGRAFVYRHEAVAQKSFENLSAGRYTALWSLVVSWARQEVFHAPEMTKHDLALWGSLDKKGYVKLEQHGSTVFITPTLAGDAMVVENGNPYFA